MAAGRMILRRVCHWVAPRARDPSRHDRGMRSLAAPAGQDSLGSEEPVNIFGSRLFAHQDEPFANIAELLRQIGIEHALTRSRAGRCR